MKKTVLVIAIILLGAVIFIRWNYFSPIERRSFNIIFSPHPPKDLISSATPDQLVSFAWNEFLSLNWKSSYYENGKRDYPDTTWSYNLNFPDLTVWETYAHRTELRPNTDKMLPFDKPPHYTYGIPIRPSGGAVFTLFNNLDEGNEIGSCNVYADKDLRVLYQAKVNRDEYQYILTNYPTKDSLRKARDSTLLLIGNAPANYNSCNPMPGKMIITLPCGGAIGSDGNPVTGTIEVKTAWRPYNSSDDVTHYITRNVITYSKRPGGTFYHNQRYVLLGMHIIHKTVSYPDFIFATFEHEDLQNPPQGQPHYSYRLLDSTTNGHEIGPFHTDYPRLRNIPFVIKQGNDYAQALIKAKNPNSPLSHYRLIGIQSDPEKDEALISKYLANYVIESDSSLGLFKGSGLDSPRNGGVNTFYKGRKLSISGCQGCHGVAQTKLGTDFSFLLSGFEPVKAPDISSPENKLNKYIKEIKAMEARSNTILKK